jgi:hypothetical protein
MNSKIILVKNINIDKQYTNVLSYTEAQMLELCLSQGHLVAQAENYSFLRNTGTIMAGFTYAQCLQANYIAFQNPDYSNKWFFAWIDDVIYKGDKNTEITFTVDAWSTWFDKWNKKVCFINRQHVNDDTIGLHTIPENLDVGEVIEESYEGFPVIDTEEDRNQFYYAIEGTYNPLTKKDYIGVTKINGSLSGAWIFLFKAYEGSVGLPNINNFLGEVNNDKKIDSILNMFILPKYLVDAIGTTHHETTGQVFGNYSFDLLNDSTRAITLAYNFEKITSYKDYIPKNNKCFVYPYNYMLISNNNGNYNIYKYEDFILDNQIAEYPILELEGAISIGASIRLIPRGYKNIDRNYDEALPLSKFPTCSWSSDAFTNWLTQNGINIATNVLLATAGVGVSIASGGTLAPAVLSIAGTVANTIGQFYQASLLPSITGGNNTGDVNFASRQNIFAIHHLRAKTEYLKIIDDYFTRFGYAIKSLELPNITGRRYWNYVEIGASEEIGYGEVPSKYMDIINNACRRGVTIWHNHGNVGNYSLNNTIVS